MPHRSSARGKSSSHSARHTASRGRAAPAAKVRFAVVGLGHIAQAAVLPAFKHAQRHAELAALITGDPAKLGELGDRYDISARYDYEGFAECLRREGIDAVYIATPNSEHRPFVEEAARLGVHVLCEKPLASTERDCRAMIDACREAGVHLMTAYRLHFDAATLKAIAAVRAGEIGDPRFFTSTFSYQIKDDGNIRLRGDLGGGALMDIGIYCVNAARNLFGAEPEAVHAWEGRDGDPRFDEVDETVCATLRFPGNRLASFVCSFAAATSGWYELTGTKGCICHDSAYEYAEGSELTITVNEKSRTRQYAKRDQFAAELVYFSRCIQDRRSPEPSGVEGLADVRVVRAIQQSIRRGCALEIPPVEDVRHPSPRQRIDRPPVRREPRLVHAQAASG